MFTNQCLRCHAEARPLRFSLKFWGGKRLRLCPNCCVAVTAAVAACMIEPQVEQLRSLFRQRKDDNPFVQELMKQAGVNLHQNPPQPPPVQTTVQQAFDLQFMCRCGSVVNKRIDISQGPHVERIHCSRCENETQVPITPELINKVMDGGQ